MAEQGLAVGFIGLGKIGSNMASHLVDWPGGLVVFDLRPESMEPLVAKGATAASSIADLSAACGVISVVVQTDAQVREVVDQLLRTSQAGQVIAVHSTVSVETVVALAESASAAGVHVLDVPVTGGGAGSRAGTLAAMVGGDPEAYERAAPVFSRWSSLAVHMGPAGAGTATKIARNLIQFAGFVAALEAQRLVAAAGLDLAKFGDVVRHSDAVTGGAGAALLRNSVDPLLPGDPWHEPYSHLCALGEKDLALALETAARVGVDLPVAAVACDHLAESFGLRTRQAR